MARASLQKRGSLLIWLDKEMTWFAPHDGRPGRPAVFSDAAIQFCLTIKVLFKLPLIPRLIDHNPWTQSRIPMEGMRDLRSVRRFQALQQ